MSPQNELLTSLQNFMNKFSFKAFFFFYLELKLKIGIIVRNIFVVFSDWLFSKT